MCVCARVLIVQNERRNTNKYSKLNICIKLRMLLQPWYVKYKLSFYFCERDILCYVHEKLNSYKT